MNRRVSSYALLALAVAAQAACASLPAGGSVPQSIGYETSPCFGACPVYRFVVDRDGSGLFEGRQHVPATGERPFTVTPAQFEAFARHLAPLRPARGEQRYAGDACRQIATDMTSVEVVWRQPTGEQRLYFYYGCDMERNEALAARLHEAPDLLPPVAALLGRPDR